MSLKMLLSNLVRREFSSTCLLQPFCPFCPAILRSLQFRWQQTQWRLKQIYKISLANCLKCKYCLWRNPKIPSWDSWVVECDMFTPRYLVLLTFPTGHSGTCNVSFCPLLQIRTDLVGHELGNSGCQIQINDHFLPPRPWYADTSIIKDRACAAKTEKSIWNCWEGKYLLQIWEFKRDKSGSSNLIHLSLSFWSRVTLQKSWCTILTPPLCGQMNTKEKIGSMQREASYTCLLSMSPTIHVFDSLKSLLLFDSSLNLIL